MWRSRLSPRGLHRRSVFVVIARDFTDNAAVNFVRGHSVRIDSVHGDPSATTPFASTTSMPWCIRRTVGLIN